MNSIFKNQGYLTITLDTGLDLVAIGATSPKILYKKPDGTLGSWAASISGTSVVYSVLNTDIDQIGIWGFQANFQVGGKDGYGDIHYKNVENPLK